MATVYDALGSKVTVVELLDQLIPGADKDLIRVLEKRVKGRYEAIHLKTGVESVEAAEDGLTVKFGDSTETFDRILVAVGRKPNGKVIGADAAGVTVDERGFIASDLQMRTNVPHIFSIGDVRGEPMLAHKATHEGVAGGRGDRGRGRLVGRALDPVGGLHRPRGRVDRASPRPRPRPRSIEVRGRARSRGPRPAAR